MKKILLGTTAVIALGAISTDAFAADKIKLGLGGFMRHYVGVIDNDEASNTGTNNTNRGMSLSQWSNTEIYASGSTTLDNGLKISTTVQFEGDGNVTRAVDESYITVSSDAMGALTVGSTEHAIANMGVRAPNAGKFDWNDYETWAKMAATSAANTNFTFTNGQDMDYNGDKAAKLKYISPTFSGVTAFGSYSAAEGANTYDARRINRNTTTDGSSFGLAYSGELGGASINADIGQFRWNGIAKDTQGGLTVGMAGFTVGGSYVRIQDDDGSASNADNNSSTNRAASDGNQWELGVGYATGPYSLSAAYTRSKTDGSNTVAGSNKDTAWNMVAAYDMGAGVALSANYFHLKRDMEGTSSTSYANGKPASVSGVIAGIEVGF